MAAPALHWFGAPRVPRLHVATPVPTPEELPWLVVMLTTFQLAGNVSITVVPALLEGPALPTVIVNTAVQPATAIGAELLVIERSDCVLTLVVAVGELFDGSGSIVVADPEAVLDTVALQSTSGHTRTTRVNACDGVPKASVGLEAVTVPDPPTGGVTVVHPAGAMKDWNRVLAGRVSDRETFCASLGPLLINVIE